MDPVELRHRRVLVVEDEPSIAECLADFFAAKGFSVTAVTRVDEADEALERGRFAIVLLDLRLPDGDGLDVLRDKRRRGDRTPVIVLTARGAEEERVRGLRAGADDYVVKPFSVYELLARVEAVLRRTGEPPSAVRIGDAEVDFDRLSVRRGAAEHRLAQKEAELLAHLVRHPGRAFRRADLLREVWGYDAAPTTRTIDTHVFQLRKKIEADPDAPSHLVTVFGVGYRFDP
jgi:two-component system, OmpR family, response regulator ResD